MINLFLVGKIGKVLLYLRNLLRLIPGVCLTLTWFSYKQNKNKNKNKNKTNQNQNKHKPQKQKQKTKQNKHFKTKTPLVELFASFPLIKSL